MFLFSFNKKFLMSLNSIKPCNLSLFVSLDDYLLDGRVARNHFISHPDYILGRLVALISILSVYLSVLLIGNLHLADFDWTSDKSCLEILTVFTYSANMRDRVDILLSCQLLGLSHHSCWQGQAQVLDECITLLIRLNLHCLSVFNCPLFSTSLIYGSSTIKSV